MSSVTEPIKATIAARVEAIRQAQANNLIENMDMGADVFEAMLEHAHQPVSNEEFARREKAALLKEYGILRASGGFGLVRLLHNSGVFEESQMSSVPKFTWPST